MSIEETRHKVNVQYKDRLFKFIFQEPEFALSLVNALTGMEYKDPKEVEITTLGDVLYINMKNDVSICIHSSMFLFEHQSTFSFNLPYRCLEYGSKLLSQYVEAHHLDVYARKAIELPEVYSIVFYNGLEERPDRETITLEVNRKKERRTAVHKSILKLKGSIQSSVEIININKGHNVRFMKMCKPLREYCWMIEGMRRKIRYGESAEQAAKEVLHNIHMEYKSNHNVVYSCKYHVVWCPKYRRSVLINGVDVRLKELIKETCDSLNVEIIEMEIMPDHVYLLMEVDPQFGVHKAVKQIKGYSSKVLRTEFPWLKSRLPSLWTNSYFVSTVGGAPLAVIKQYIENQKNV